MATGKKATGRKDCGAKALISDGRHGGDCVCNASQGHKGAHVCGRPLKGSSKKCQARWEGDAARV